MEGFSASTSPYQHRTTARIYGFWVHDPWYPRTPAFVPDQFVWADVLCERYITPVYVSGTWYNYRVTVERDDSIAAGRIQAVGLLKAGSSLRDGFVDAAPTEPLLVKSYDPYVQDYYLVRFVKNGKPSGLVVLYLENGKVHCGHAARYADTATQPLPVMKDQAIAILKNAYQLESVPDPRLIYQGLCQEIHDPLQPAWEFDLGGKKAYVNQEGKVFAAFTRPEKLGG